MMNDRLVNSIVSIAKWLSFIWITFCVVLVNMILLIVAIEEMMIRLY